MGKQYKPKQKTGNEYVLDAKEFSRTVDFTLSKLPEEFADTFPINKHIKQASKAAERIKKLTKRANGYPINKKDPEKMIKMLNKRAACLEKALRKFDEYDDSFENIMSHIDLFMSERARLNAIFCQIIREYGFDITKPEFKDYDPQAILSGQGRPIIEMHGHVSDIEYKALNGNQMYKIGITARNRDHLLKLEETARDGISSRLYNDKRIVEKLSAKINKL